jgi:hypothetical protein
MKKHKDSLSRKTLKSRGLNPTDIKYLIEGYNIEKDGWKKKK